MELVVEAVNKYDTPERGIAYRPGFYGIGLNISGLIYAETCSDDGQLLRSYHGNGKEEPPSLSLATPGKICHFEYNEHRENWIIFLREPVPFYYDRNTGKIFMRSHAGDFPLRSRVPLDREETAPLRRLFQEIRHKTQSGLPHEHADAELLAAQLLRRFIPRKENIHSAAVKLKELIDADNLLRQSLEELAQAAGYSRDHIRQLFVQEYGLTPGEYRTRQRLALILQLISGTDMSLKEIAEKAGIAHASYLNQLIRKYYHTTPKELCRRLRQGA